MSKKNKHVPIESVPLDNDIVIAVALAYGFEVVKIEGGWIVTATDDNPDSLYEDQFKWNSTEGPKDLSSQVFFKRLRDWFIAIGYDEGHEIGYESGYSDGADRGISYA